MSEASKNPSVVYATAVPIDETNATGGALPHPIPVEPNNKNELDERTIGHLKEQGFSTGLARSLAANNLSFPLRIWVVDNSGSMQTTDGNRLVETSDKNNLKTVSCSRWEEIKECVNYHIQMAGLLRAHTAFRVSIFTCTTNSFCPSFCFCCSIPEVFRSHCQGIPSSTWKCIQLLNNPGIAVGPQKFSVAETGPELMNTEVQTAMGIMRKARPGGVTPLSRHVDEIKVTVQAMEPQLRAEGKQVVVILATDGLPTDEGGAGGNFVHEQFVESLRSLEGLPVWVVIRLCTSQEDVVNFYNDLDKQLELSVDVLDDYVGEAEELYKYNPWLTYGLPLHRMREMGFHDRLLDFLDERALTMGEIREFCSLLLGEENFDGVADPSEDWSQFFRQLNGILSKEKPQWNPVKKKLTPWIDLEELNRIHGDSSCCVM